MWLITDWRVSSVLPFVLLARSLEVSLLPDLLSLSAFWPGGAVSYSLRALEKTSDCNSELTGISSRLAVIHLSQLLTPTWRSWLRSSPKTQKNTVGSAAVCSWLRSILDRKLYRTT